MQNKDPDRIYDTINQKALRIGYACKCVAVPGTQISTCIAARATADRLTELIEGNLNALDRMLDYNINNGIRLFRISSDIIPFGSSPVNTLDWGRLFADRLKALGDKAVGSGIRLSMHPGQYTVLNSPDAGVVIRAVEDLVYHCRFLDALGLSAEHKIILHIGGVYGDKPAAVERFCKSYKALPEAVKKRLVIENDERNYNIRDVCDIGLRMGIPVVFDNLHYALNLPERSQPESGQTDSGLTEAGWLELCRTTWKRDDGPQKMHYAQQEPGKRPGAHSNTINLDAFIDYQVHLPAGGIDIMLEVKDKNRSALKCINCCTGRYEIKYLEAEWARYKYDVLGRSQNIYQEIRNLLKDKDGYPAGRFYDLIDQALNSPDNTGAQLNAMDHVWGYFKDRATAREKTQYKKKVEEFRAGRIDEAAVRGTLYRLAVKYQDDYLLNSYYFS